LHLHERAGAAKNGEDFINALRRADFLGRFDKRARLNGAADASGEQWIVLFHLERVEQCNDCIGG
jgi:hypothetical protein